MPAAARADGRLTRACSAATSTRPRELIELAGGGARLGLCLDSCHLFVQGYDITDAEKLAAVLDEADAKVGLERLRRSARERRGARRSAPAGTATPTSARARWGAAGLAAFLSEPRFEGLPAAIETPGPDKHGPDRKEVQAAKRLRKAGLKARQKD